VAPLKRDAVARLVRGKIADGTLKPGGAVPSAAALARESGCHEVTCRTALRVLLADGTLIRGVSANARLRVAQPGGAGRLSQETLRDALSRTLAARRRGEGLTQPELAAELGVSVTTLGHAETGRVWQARDFWARADRLLGDGLLSMYDAYQAARYAPTPEEAGVTAPAEPGPGEPAAAGPVLPVSVTITPDGVAVMWPDGTQTLARPPGPARELRGGPDAPGPAPDQGQYRRESRCAATGKSPMK
jgi:DNA-binding transcriptional regulator YhcF (GntR family)